MKKPALLMALLLMSASIAALGCQSSATPQKADDVLFQYSALDSLMAGVYDGDITFGELKQHGDLGLGTFNTLDGEMVEVDHQFYQVKSDGVAYPVADSMKAPFAEVTYFSADQTIEVGDPLDCGHLESYLDSRLPSLNVPYAIKITGVFAQLQTRSVPQQTKPYPPLAQVVKKQSTFDFSDVSGVMVGFRLPGYMAGVGAAGYHLHFLTDDRKAGGHVLGCQVQRVTAEIDTTSELNMVLPNDPAFYHVDLSTSSPQSSNATE
ncbi:MAG: acetolactate decarboxylase [Candidatus Limnocylindrales bacterium]